MYFLVACCQLATSAAPGIALPLNLGGRWRACGAADRVAGLWPGWNSDRGIAVVIRSLGAGMPMPIPPSCPGQGTVLRLCLSLLVILCGRRIVALSPDGMALDDMRMAFQGYSGGAFSNWDITLVNPCSWFGVTCSQDGVTTVVLPGKGLSGPLSPRVGDLAYLETLKLSDNNISGSIPETIGNLSKLMTLDLGTNRLSGPIPESLSKLTVLQNLILKKNLLSGSIPAGVTSIPTLKAVDLSNNNLSGRVPEGPPGVNVNVTGNALLCGEAVAVPCPSATAQAEMLSQGGGGTSAGAVGGAIAAAAVVAALALALLALWWRRQRSGGLYRKEEFFDVQEEQDPQIRFAQLREFSLREMQMATDTFHSRHILGQGGFSKVYKGTLEDGSEVAVKRLNRGGVAGGERAFQMEVEMIGLAVHRNLLRLQGYCVTQAERMLVYPYMRNGSVAQRLRETSPGINWQARRKIAVGSARGLAYLHDFCEPKIIHRDVKAANVLLDDDLEAVVGDFGLAKLLDGSQTHITTMVRGTAGHIAPEYLTTGKSSEKTDVFGYGIMLLELLTGQRAFDFARLAAEDDVMLLDWVKRLQLEGRQAELVDPNLLSRAGGYDPGEAEELIQVALLCTQGSPGERPRMAEVVRMLEGDGLAERWQEWQRVEVVRRHEIELLPRNLPQWVHDSTGNIDAIQLSSGR